MNLGSLSANGCLANFAGMDTDINPSPLHVGPCFYSYHTHFAKNETYSILQPSELKRISNKMRRRVAYSARHKCEDCKDIQLGMDMQQGSLKHPLDRNKRPIYCPHKTIHCILLEF